MNLEKLTADANRARTLAITVCNESDDAGSCNLDSVFLPLDKGQRAMGVLAALNSAGLSASTTIWIGRGIMIQPPGTGRANKRYASNQALCRSLKADGWPVLAYYQMD